jgi:hypothetical protein
MAASLQSLSRQFLSLETWCKPEVMGIKSRKPHCSSVIIIKNLQLDWKCPGVLMSSWVTVNNGNALFF